MYNITNKTSCIKHILLGHSMYILPVYYNIYMSVLDINSSLNRHFYVVGLDGA